MNGHKYPRQWENISASTDRLQVKGGWLVRETLQLIVGGHVAASVAIIFQTDPDHNWVLEDKR